MSKVLTDTQLLECIGIVHGLRVLKLSGMRLKVIAAMRTERNFRQMQKLKEELAYLEEKRDEAADILTMTID